MSKGARITLGTLLFLIEVLMIVLLAILLASQSSGA
jgi:hypothetical protein